MKLEKFSFSMNQKGVFFARFGVRPANRFCRAAPLGITAAKASNLFARCLAF